MRNDLVNSRFPAVLIFYLIFFCIAGWLLLQAHSQCCHPSKISANFTASLKHVGKHRLSNHIAQSCLRCPSNSTFIISFVFVPTGNYKILAIPKQLEKLGIWQEGALHLRQAKPARKQHNLNKLCDGRGLKGNGCRRSQKPIFQVVWVYKLHFHANQDKKSRIIWKVKTTRVA